MFVRAFVVDIKSTFNTLGVFAQAAKEMFPSSRNMFNLTACEAGFSLSEYKCSSHTVQDIRGTFEHKGFCMIQRMYVVSRSCIKEFLFGKKCKWCTVIILGCGRPRFGYYQILRIVIDKNSDININKINDNREPPLHQGPMTKKWIQSHKIQFYTYQVNSEELNQTLTTSCNHNTYVQIITDSCSLTVQ